MIYQQYFSESSVKKVPAITGRPVYIIEFGRDGDDAESIYDMKTLLYMLKEYTSEVITWVGMGNIQSSVSVYIDAYDLKIIYVQPRQFIVNKFGGVVR